MIVTFRSIAFLLTIAATVSASLPLLPNQARVIPLPSNPVSLPAAIAAAPAPLAQPTGNRESILDLARKGRLDSAHRLCLQALGGKPDDQFLLLMAGKLGASGKESAEAFKKAVLSGGQGPEAEESQFRLGQYTYATGKYHLAIPFFRDYLRKFPNGDWKQPALYWVGNASLALSGSRPDRTNYLDSAAAWFGKLRDETKPSDYYHPLALVGLAKAKGAKGDRESAWRIVLSALDRAPEEERPALLLLAAQVRQGVDRASEKSYLAQLRAYYPQSPEARYLRKLNGKADTSKWKSGSGFPSAASPVKDTAQPGAASQTDSAKSETTFDLPKPPASIAKPPQPSTDTNIPAMAPTYTLQCGAFTQSANAQAMLTSLAKLGLSPELVERERAGKRIFQVRVGRFTTVEAAEAFADKNLKPQRVLSHPVTLTP